MKKAKNQGVPGPGHQAAATWNRKSPPEKKKMGKTFIQCHHHSSSLSCTRLPLTWLQGFLRLPSGPRSHLLLPAFLNIFIYYFMFYIIFAPNLDPFLPAPFPPTVQDSTSSHPSYCLQCAAAIFMLLLLLLLLLLLALLFVFHLLFCVSRASFASFYLFAGNAAAAAATPHTRTDSHSNIPTYPIANSQLPHGSRRILPLRPRPLGHPFSPKSFINRTSTGSIQQQYRDGSQAIVAFNPHLPPPPTTTIE